MDKINKQINKRSLDIAKCPPRAKSSVGNHCPKETFTPVIQEAWANIFVAALFVIAKH